ncbi:anti-sigma factor family protein [Heyndrickxia camelliae]|uniref:Zinc-finger domain-containing protein n=1 Tax=Heyndrickxia camelliae TaxID=1707093 RepID=A0A2N3LHK1_9BACI|nr:hypothetical protein [Heyndrickxia camelliae]PKR84013.1 hypothetical protein CWO92_15955 [Heyndrickxia camelliae]
MNHISYERWLQYVRGELDSATEQQYDDHLYSCDQCLSVYLEAVEAQEQLLPAMSNEDSFTEMVMQQIEGQKRKTVGQSKKQSLYQKASFHYLVAAAMTILLMTSGVFSHLTNALNDFEAKKKKEPSVVMGLMNKSVSLIDKVERESEEGNK